MFRRGARSNPRSHRHRVLCDQLAVRSVSVARTLAGCTRNGGARADSGAGRRQFLHFRDVTRSRGLCDVGAETAPRIDRRSDPFDVVARGARHTAVDLTELWMARGHDGCSRSCARGAALCGESDPPRPGAGFSRCTDGVSGARDVAAGSATSNTRGLSGAGDAVGNRARIAAGAGNHAAASGAAGRGRRSPAEASTIARACENRISRRWVWSGTSAIAGRHCLTRTATLSSRWALPLRQR